MYSSEKAQMVSRISILKDVQLSLVSSVDGETGTPIPGVGNYPMCCNADATAEQRQNFFLFFRTGQM